MDIKKIPEFQGTLRKFMLKVPEEIKEAKDKVKDGLKGIFNRKK